MQSARCWPDGPQRPLPKTVAPFESETVASYVARLAHANHLEPGKLRRYVAGSVNACARPDWLAIASGLSEATLRARLRGFAPHERSLANQRTAWRPICRLCMARRGITNPVYCCMPQHITVCHRHQLWIGSPVRTLDDQRDLRNNLHILTAARLHGRLARHHSDVEINAAMRDARHFLSYWANAENRSTTAVLNDRVDAHLGTYPEAVAITATLLIYNKQPAERGTVGPTELLRYINGQTDRTHIDATPIEQWLHHQRLAATAHRSTEITDPAASGKGR
jgi:hypothetical protein